MSHRLQEPNRRKRCGATLAAGVLLISLGSAVFAHGEMKHVLGIVREIGADHVVVETKDGAKESITTDANTRYFRGDAAAKSDELKVGDRIVVHATNSDPPTAKTIRFSTPKTAK
jgi:Domain of unknown function (DUF5666)